MDSDLIIFYLKLKKLYYERINDKIIIYNILSNLNKNRLFWIKYYLKKGDNMENFIWETAEELDQKLAQRVRNIRKRRSISQEKLASMSGVSYGSIKRFETSGQISLISLTKIAMALDIADDIRNLFTTVPYRDIQEVINETK